ncbi:alpha/beta-hydrolase [Meredithblackwellia eburnea MCA 4105]
MFNPGPSPTSTYTFKTVGSLQIEADVFLPQDESKKDLPILLWFHGGGLLMSMRKGIGPHLRRAASKYGLCVVSADYRLAPQMSVPSIIEDVRDAAVWTRGELPKLLGEGKVDVDRLVVSGGSAGGYLALMAGSPKLGISPPPKAIIAVYPITNPFGPFFQTPQRPVPATPGGECISHESMAPHINPDGPVLNGYGPVPFPPPPGDRGLLYLYMVQEGILEKLLFAKAPEGTVKEDYNTTSFITKDFPPTYVFHGAVDNRVGIEQSYALVKALKSAGVPYEFDEIPEPDAQHLFDQLDSSVEMDNMYKFVLKYI